MNKHLLVVGATGLLGHAVLKHFLQRPDWRCTGLSRRPLRLKKVTHLKADLMNKRSLTKHAAIFAEITHVVYAALYEMDNLLDGWRHKDQIAINSLMFNNLLETLDNSSPYLKHISMLQGTKAYGIHVEPMTAPAKEKWPRHNHENFYWLQEDNLKYLQNNKKWSYTIWRPQVVFGTAAGSPMNLVAAVAAYATICREQGTLCCYPGGDPVVTEATDAELFAEALEWAFSEPKSKNETYNITNGDVLIWPHLWPVICDYFNVVPGHPEPRLLSSTMPSMENEWKKIVDKYSLKQLTLRALIGGSWQFLDRALHPKGKPVPPSLVSTIKIRKAGFNGCIDTEESIKRCFKEMQKEHLIP